jgi:hypothetical protein
MPLLPFGVKRGWYVCMYMFIFAVWPCHKISASATFFECRRSIVPRQRPFGLQFLCIVFVMLSLFIFFLCIYLNVQTNKFIFFLISFLSFLYLLNVRAVSNTRLRVLFLIVCFTRDHGFDILLRTPMSILHRI